MRAKFGITLVMLIIVAASPVVQAQKVKRISESCVLITQKCNLKIKQTKWGFEFGGIDFAAKSPVSKVGTVKLNTDVIQKLSDVAQVLDQMQFSRCQLINGLATCDSARQPILIAAAVANEQLGQLALLAQMYSDDSSKLQDAFLKWIIQSADLVQKIYQKQFMGADPQLEANQNKVRGALEFAATKLNVTPNSPEFVEAMKGIVQRTLE